MTEQADEGAWVIFWVAIALVAFALALGAVLATGVAP